MTVTDFSNITQIESSLWEAADQLRANSKLTSSEYRMPDTLNEMNQQLRAARDLLLPRLMSGEIAA